MRLRRITVFLVTAMLSVASSAQERGNKNKKDEIDAYLGYSRVGANLYAPNSSGMNGWQLAMHIKPLPFVGIEGDVSRYSQSSSGFAEQVTLAMFGPRVTVHAAGFSVFAHALAGIAHAGETVTIYPSVGYNATSYALGGGAEMPLALGFKLRVTSDYLGNSKAPSAGSPSPAHCRVGVGIAYHF